MKQVDHIINILQLQPHPEGGFFKETYRSSGAIEQDGLPSGYSGRRNHSTCIYFLLTSDTFSAFHRIIQDEIWHFYGGSPISLFMIHTDGRLQNVIIGNDLTNGEVPQFVVPGGSWFAARVVDLDSFTLLGCTVAPGFDFNDFTLANRNELIALFPQHSELITYLTRN